MKKLLTIFILLFSIFSISGCVNSDEYNFKDKMFIYENEGFGSEFYVAIKKDGTFNYSVGMLSSQLGYGKWTYENEILTLTEGEGENKTINNFKVGNGYLSYIEENSTGFMHVDVKKGEKFNEHTPQK